MSARGADRPDAAGRPAAAAEELEVSVLVGLAASAVEAHLLTQLHQAGHGGIRAVHGYVFQRLLVAPCSVGALATDLKVTQQRVSTLVAELEAGHYVRRDPRPGDARIRDVVLTEKGRDVVDLSRQLRATLESELESRIGDLTLARATLAALLDLTGAMDDVNHRRVPIPSVG